MDGWRGKTASGHQGEGVIAMSPRGKLGGGEVEEGKGKERKTDRWLEEAEVWPSRSLESLFQVPPGPCGEGVSSWLPAWGCPLTENEANNRWRSRCGPGVGQKRSLQVLSSGE